MADNTDKAASIYPWSDAIKTLFNMGMGIANNIQQQKWNKQQQKNWETQFEYTKWLNNTMMQREDTAVQRSVADYQAAGFNKLLAVGNPSQAGTLNSFTGNAGGSAPQMEANIKDPISAYLEARQLNAETQLTEEQANLVNQQAKTESERKNFYESMVILNKAKAVKTNREAENLVIDYLTKVNDYEFDMRYGTKSNDSGQINNAWQLGYRLLMATLINGGNVDIANVISEVAKFLGIKTDYIDINKMTDEERAEWLEKKWKEGIEKHDRNRIGNMGGIM